MQKNWNDNFNILMFWTTNLMFLTQWQHKNAVNKIRLYVPNLAFVELKLNAYLE